MGRWRSYLNVNKTFADSYILQYSSQPINQKLMLTVVYVYELQVESKKMLMKILKIV